MEKNKLSVALSGCLTSDIEIILMGVFTNNKEDQNNLGWYLKK